MALIKTHFYIAFLLWFIPYNSFSQVTDTTNRDATILFTQFLSNQNKLDTVAVAKKVDFYGFFKVINCISGTLYFSGNGFSNIVSIKYTGNVNELKIYFERCVTGSKFTLENCSFLRDGGEKPLILSKTVLFL